MAKPKRRIRAGRAGFTGVAAAAIPLAGFLAFGMIPLILALIVSFTELHTTDLSLMEFVGFDNYRTILTNADGYTYSSYWSTFVYLLNIPLCMGLSVWISTLVNRVRIGRKFFSVVLFIPYVCSTVVITLAFRTLLFNMDSGVLNDLLYKLGFEPVGWLVSSPWLFEASAIAISVWKGLGWCIVLYQAALSNVDPVYYEAAAIDGATPGQMFCHITWPAISPTTGYMLIIKFIGSMQEVEMMMLLTRNGGTPGLNPVWPFGEAWVSDTVVKHIYNMIFERPYLHGYGLAAAAGWVLAIVIFIVTWLIMKSQKRWVNYDF